MAENKEYRPKGLTYTVLLPGGQQQRLQELILYVSDACQTATRFGMIKLDKIIWRADFTAFAARRVPVTGCAYQKLALGPAPTQMRPLLEEMRSAGQIEIESVDFSAGISEKRVVAVMPPSVRFFSRDDLDYVDAAIQFYWNKTGQEASDNSHGIGWHTREEGDPMPYELAFLSDKILADADAARFEAIGRERGWVSA